DRNVTGVQTCALPISSFYLRHRSQVKFRWYLQEPLQTNPLHEAKIDPKDQLLYHTKTFHEIHHRRDNRGRFFHYALIYVRCKTDRKSTRLNSSHVSISYTVF